MFNQYDALLRRIAALEKKVQQLEDDQIKQNRDYKDAMYNLDADNVPKLNGIYKEIKLISETGISLAGKTIDLTADNIKIASDNFRVDETGHVEMGSADIKQNCVLASDIDEGNAMRIGPTYVDSPPDSSDTNEANISYSELEVFYEDDGFSLGSSRGLSFTTVFQRSTVSSDGSTLISEISESAKEIKLHSYGSEDSYDNCEVGIKRDGNQGKSGAAYLKVGENYFWVDKEGVHTTANEIDLDAFFPV